MTRSKNTSKNWSARWRPATGDWRLYLKTVFFFLLLPGTVTAWVPIYLLRCGGAHFALGPVRLLGLVPLALGLAVLLWCVWDFARIGRGTLSPVDPPKIVVERGLYRIVRNPMYVGVLTILAGEVLLFESWSLLGWMALVAIGFNLFVVLYEEPTLERKFGDSYRRYRAAVPRWIPRIRPH